MTRKEADRVIAVIKKDANARGDFFRARGRMCVIGGLYQEAFPEGDRRGNVLGRVIREYHLTCAYSLMRINDQYPKIADRRAALIEKVESWIEED